VPRWDGRSVCVVEGEMVVGEGRRIESPSCDRRTYRTYYYIVDDPNAVRPFITYPRVHGIGNIFYRSRRCTGCSSTTKVTVERTYNIILCKVNQKRHFQNHVVNYGAVVFIIRNYLMIPVCQVLTWYAITYLSISAVEIYYYIDICFYLSE